MSQVAKRKQRTVKNALVDIDKVTIEPGDNYQNWIETTKQKLQERDHMLLQQKIRKIKSTVNNELRSSSPNYNFNNFEIKQEIIDNTVAIWSNRINRWSGIKQTESPILTYRNYFDHAKKWWDGKKRRLLGSTFWLPVLQYIEMFVGKIDDNRNLLLIILNQLFKATVKYPNTKATQLINSGTIIHSDEIHEYLYRKHHLLTVNKWVKDTIGCKQRAKIIHLKITDTLTHIVSRNKVNNNNNNNSITNQPEQLTTYTYNSRNCNNNQYTNNQYRYGNNQSVPYLGIHQSTNSVSDVRYTPLSFLMMHRNITTNNQNIPFVNNASNMPICLCLFVLY